MLNFKRVLSRRLGQTRLFSIAQAAKRLAPIDVHPEVAEALATNKPVVALETTLVTHGFPYPTNYELSTSLEDIVRSTGAIPATIGIIQGRVKIGMEKPELERLADRATFPNTVKVSRRDIAPVISMKMDGGTTCSSTLIFAAMAGIKVFATGGLGGVHRNGESTMDVSADLFELTRCPVGLVSSGVKSILDIGRTLEYLETLGVPTVAYGPSRDFPAFFTRHSGFQVPYNVPTAEMAASLLHTQWQLGMENGALIAVPIPEEFEPIGASIQRAVEQAIEESEANGISKKGKEATPWLLARVAELTGGDSMISNVALLKNTALVGGQIAVSYQKLADSSILSPSFSITPRPTVALESPPVRHASLGAAKLAIIGSSAVDITAKASLSSKQALAAQSTVPGSVEMSLGGVARNVAEAAHQVSTDAAATVLISPIGNDSFGNLLLKETKALGMRTDGFVKSEGSRTAVCNMLLSNDGHLITGVADMDITVRFSGDEILNQLEKHKPYLVAFDGNISSAAAEILLTHCSGNGTKTFFEPTSIAKSSIILPAISTLCETLDPWIPPLTFASPNVLELRHMYQSAREEDSFDLMSKPRWWSVIDPLGLGQEYRMDLEKLERKLSGVVDIRSIAGMAIHLLPFISHLVIKCGDKGVVVVMYVSGMANSGWRKSNIEMGYIVAEGSGGRGVVVAHCPALDVQTIQNVTGAGDSFVGVLLRLLEDPEATRHPATLTATINRAQEAAILTLQSDRAVSLALADLPRI